MLISSFAAASMAGSCHSVIFVCALSVTTALACRAPEPAMSGLGGYGTILIYDAAKQQARFLNASGRIPRGVDSDAFRPPTPDYEENRRGPKAISAPGNAKAWEALWTQYGKLPLIIDEDNAYGVVEFGKRFILYSPRWFAQLKQKTGTYFSTSSIVAHELNPVEVKFLTWADSELFFVIGLVSRARNGVA